MANKNLSAAKSAKNDEFYTQYADIQKEVNAYLEYDADVFRDKTVLLPCDDPEWSNFTKFFAQNFQRFGLKKLISTSYAVESKNIKTVYQPTLFEMDAPQFDKKKTRVKGKIFVLDHDTNKNGRIDIEDLEWKYLKGDGDFRSDEVKKLRDEADIIVTNPPFSLFREFLAWIVGKDGASRGGAEPQSGRARTPAAPQSRVKKFLILGNKNAVKYKDVFPLIQMDRIWSGRTEWSGGLWFETKDEGDYDRIVDGVMMKNVASVWFTNLEHGRRHQPISLMTERDNIKYSKHKEIRGVGYQQYVNYDAIEVSYTDAIPSDYKGVMGVPISFLDKYSPDQFEIIGTSPQLANPIVDYVEPDAEFEKGGPACYLKVSEKKYRRLYDRIFIRFRKEVTSGSDFAS